MVNNLPQAVLLAATRKRKDTEANRQLIPVSFGSGKKEIEKGFYLFTTTTCCAELNSGGGGKSVGKRLDELHLSLRCVEWGEQLENDYIS